MKVWTFLIMLQTTNKSHLSSFVSYSTCSFSRGPGSELINQPFQNKKTAKNKENISGRKQRPCLLIVS